MSSIEVLSPGLYTTIQDQGRKGFRSFGIPVSGAMDQLSADLGNALLENKPDAPVLEMTIIGPKLLFNSGVDIVITGADLSGQINDIPFHTNIIKTVHPGDILSFGKSIYGCHSYLCLKNGFNSTQHFGSCSTYEKAGLGHPVLKKGMKLQFVENETTTTFTGSRIKPNDKLFTEQRIPVVPGPEYDLINQKLITDCFEITPESNRMGYRLKGTIDFKHDHSILTSTVIPGTIQLPPSGDPVVLMRDCQTTGGYPRVLQVSEMGLNTLAQKKPGDRITFELLE